MIFGKKSGRAHVNIFQGFYFKELYFSHDIFGGSARAGSGVYLAQAARTAPTAHESNTFINLGKEAHCINCSRPRDDNCTQHIPITHISTGLHQYKHCEWKEKQDKPDLIQLEPKTASKRNKNISQNLSSTLSFNRWTALWDWKSDPELALFLLDRYVL